MRRFSNLVTSFLLLVMLLWFPLRRSGLGDRNLSRSPNSTYVDCCDLYGGSIVQETTERSGANGYFR